MDILILLSICSQGLDSLIQNEIKDIRSAMNLVDTQNMGIEDYDVMSRDNYADQMKTQLLQFCLRMEDLGGMSAPSRQGPNLSLG